MAVQEQPVLVEATDLCREFVRGGRRGARIRAVDGVSFAIRKGDAIGLVGESGSGKTTTARCIVGLDHATAGVVLVDGREARAQNRRELRAMRSRVQYVFQDPYDSLDPRWRVEDIVAEPLVAVGQLPGAERAQRVRDVLALVQLDESFLRRYPHELSGGQRQRVGIARALVTDPELVVLDEPTSALDWATRAEVLELLHDLRKRLGTAYLFIAHDLGAIREVCDHVMVMYLGRIVESAPTEELFADPQHPYTRSLLSAVLSVDPDARTRRQRLRGDPPSPADVPSGCPLHPRCPVSVDLCAATDQQLVWVRPGHDVACMRVTDPADVVEWPEQWRERS